VIHEKLREFSEKLPGSVPDLEIGPLYFWFGPSQNGGKKDYEDWKMPMLLIKDNILLYSPTSYVFAWEINKLHTDLSKMYQNIGRAYTVEFEPMDAQFHLIFKSDLLGSISLKIKYISWGEADANLEIKDTIDQSYLPSIINFLKTIANY
jgi:hypothetical protein